MNPKGVTTYCPTCCKDYPVAATYCIRCGNAMVRAAAWPKCPHCETYCITKGDNFCRNCGRSLHD